MKRPNRELPKIVGQGFTAFQVGKAETENPYPKYSDSWHSWQRGWADASFGKMMVDKYGIRHEA